MKSIWVRFDESERPALAVKTTKAGVHLLYLREGYGVDTLVVPDKGEQYRPVTYHGAPYPVERHIRHFKRMAKASGITKRAKTLLAEATLA